MIGINILILPSIIVGKEYYRKSIIVDKVMLRLDKSFPHFIEFLRSMKVKGNILFLILNA